MGHVDCLTEDFLLVLIWGRCDCQTIGPIPQGLMQAELSLLACKGIIQEAA